MKYKTGKQILKFHLARSSRHWMKNIRFKKHNNISLYKFINLFLHNFNEDEIMDRSYGVAFNFILAIFPAIIFLFTLIPYISVYFPEITTETIMQFLKDACPPNMYETISSTVLDIVSNHRGGLLTFGVVLALYTSTNGMSALMRAFNASYRTVEKRNWFRAKLTALGLTLVLSLVVFLAIILIFVGTIALNYVAEHIEQFSHFNIDHYTLFLFHVFRFAIIFIVFFIAISCIYYFGPSIHYNWNFFSIGSFLTTLSVLGLSYVFSYYIANFSSYNKVYGSIGALIALMAWIQLMTLVLLIGYEINATLHSAHGSVQRLQKNVKSFR